MSMKAYHTAISRKTKSICTPEQHARANTHLGVVENAASVVGADDGVFAVLAEVGRGDEARLSVHLVPQSHLLVRNIPQAQLAVQRAAQEVAVVLRDTGADAR